MIQIINQGLLITVLGMGLVFVMIIALWGIMALLVNITNKKTDNTETEGVETSSQTTTRPDEKASYSNAAAAAVAYALLQEKNKPRNSASHGFSESSNWLAVGRLKQTLRNPHRGRKL